jgi:hypothetical protein
MTIKERHKKYYDKNIQWYRDYQKKYSKEKYHNDINYRMRAIVSRRIHSALKNMINEPIAMKYLGCSIEYFKQWIEFQFYDNMTWDNYGILWHIDHVIPVSSFDFSNDDEIVKCFNWLNLRPLRKDKNMSKSNKIIPAEYLFQEIKQKAFLKITA